jgi:hypothetical protein
MSASFEHATAVADAVLYEGYLLYPYTASALKNQMRWQFGVVVPHAYAQNGNGETASLQAEMVARRHGDAPVVRARVRFLQLQARTIEAFDPSGGTFRAVAGLNVAGEDYITWDEAVERHVDASVGAHLPEAVVPFEFAARVDRSELRESDGMLRGRIVRERWKVRGSVELCLVNLDSAHSIVRVRVRNESDVAQSAGRSAALRSSLLSTHVLLSIDGGAWISSLDPTDDAAPLVARLQNSGLFPVLAGDRAPDAHASQVALASPIILYDFPTVSAQSRGDAFDATEIDELLNLSVLGLSDAERREARATDSAARAIVDRAESLEVADFAGLHGVLNDENVEPGSECVEIDGAIVATGSRVRLRPKRRADVWDAFLQGKTARVRGVYRDMEARVYVAVTVDDDPASDLHEWHGRSLFFGCDEVEPLEAPS